MNRKQRIELALHWILLGAGLVIFALLIRNVGGPQLARLYRAAVKPLWIAGVLVYLLSMLLRAVKWHLLIGSARPVPFLKFLPVYLFNAYMGNITPFKSGEAAGPVLFRRHFGIGVGQGFSVLLIDRIMELIWMLTCLVTGFFYLVIHGVMSPILSKTILAGGVFTALLIAFLISVLLVESLGHGTVSWLFEKTGGPLQRLAGKIRSELDVFYQFRKGAALGRKMVLLNLYTALAFIAQFLAVWLVVVSLIRVDFMASLSAQAIAIPISILSFIPAGIGIAALGYQSIMALFGYPYDEIVGAAVISKILFLALIFVSGWLASFRMRRMTEDGV